MHFTQSQKNYLHEDDRNYFAKLKKNTTSYKQLVQLSSAKISKCKRDVLRVANSKFVFSQLLNSSLLPLWLLILMLANSCTIITR